MQPSASPSAHSTSKACSLVRSTPEGGLLGAEGIVDFTDHRVEIHIREHNGEGFFDRLARLNEGEELGADDLVFGEVELVGVHFRVPFFVGCFCSVALSMHTQCEIISHCATKFAKESACFA